MTQYIVNHGGVVHSVNDDDLQIALGNASIPPSRENPAGSPARMATPDEIAAWYTAQGLAIPAEYQQKPTKGDK